MSLCHIYNYEFSQRMSAEENITSASEAETANRAEESSDDSDCRIIHEVPAIKDRQSPVHHLTEQPAIAEQSTVREEPLPASMSPNTEKYVEELLKSSSSSLESIPDIYIPITQKKKKKTKQRKKRGEVRPETPSYSPHPPRKIQKKSVRFANYSPSAWECLSSPPTISPPRVRVTSPTPSTGILNLLTILSVTSCNINQESNSPPNLISSSSSSPSNSSRPVSPPGETPPPQNDQPPPTNQPGTPITPTTKTTELPITPPTKTTELFESDSSNSVPSPKPGTSNGKSSHGFTEQEIVTHYKLQNPNSSDEDEQPAPRTLNPFYHPTPPRITIPPESPWNPVSFQSFLQSTITPQPTSTNMLTEAMSTLFQPDPSLLATPINHNTTITNYDIPEDHNVTDTPDNHTTNITDHFSPDNHTITITNYDTTDIPNTADTVNTPTDDHTADDATTADEINITIEIQDEQVSAPSLFKALDQNYIISDQPDHNSAANQFNILEPGTTLLNTTNYYITIGNKEPGSFNKDLDEPCTDKTILALSKYENNFLKHFVDKFRCKNILDQHRLITILTSIQACSTSFISTFQQKLSNTKTSIPRLQVILKNVIINIINNNFYMPDYFIFNNLHFTNVSDPSMKYFLSFVPTDCDIYHPFMEAKLKTYCNPGLPRSTHLDIYCHSTHIIPQGLIVITQMDIENGMILGKHNYGCKYMQTIFNMIQKDQLDTSEFNIHINNQERKVIQVHSEIKDISLIDPCLIEEFYARFIQGNKQCSPLSKLLFLPIEQINFEVVNSRTGTQNLFVLIPGSEYATKLMSICNSPSWFECLFSKRVINDIFRSAFTQKHWKNKHLIQQRSFISLETLYNACPFEKTFYFLFAFKKDMILKKHNIKQHFKFSVGLPRPRKF